MIGLVTIGIIEIKKGAYAGCRRFYNVKNGEGGDARLSGAAFARGSDGMAEAKAFSV